MDVEEIPEKMTFARPMIERFESFSRDSGLTRQEIALGYLRMEAPGAKVIFGADTPEQVRENLRTWEKDISFSLVSEVKEIFGGVDEKILNPGLW